MPRALALVAGLALLSTGCGTETPPPEEHPACAPLGLSDQGDVRAFVVGHKQTLEDAVSYETFEASFRRHVEAIAPCLSERRPNLVVFPENAALGALLIGSRGAEARSQSDSISAFGAIINAYGKPFAWYNAQYPNAPLRRKVLLSLTDTVWRAFERTFAGIARDFGVWVMSSADVAPAELSSDPALITELGDPDLPGQTEVWVASGPEAFNSAYLFDPSGARVGRVDKVFLTDPEEADLELDNGALAAVTALRTPFGSIGAATSRDAFYPPFMQRLEDLDVDLVVQPEAFSGWGLGELPLEWYPDVFTSSAWTHQQKYRTFRHNLTPQYTGNFFELYFDGQLHVTGRAVPGGARGAYIGQDPIPGFAKVGPWVVPDPADSEPLLTIDERRSALRDVGLELLPGSGAARENGYIDSLIAIDLELPSAEDAAPIAVSRDTSRPESRAIAAGAGGHQRNADVAGGPSAAVVVWQEQASGGWRIRYATTTNGADFDVHGEVAPGGDAIQRRPAVCTAADGRVAAVWQEGAPERVMAALAPSAGAPFAAAIAVSPAGGPAWEADCAFSAGGELVVVYSDLSSGVARLVSSTLPSGASAFSAPLAVDDASASAPRVAGTQLQAALSSDAQVVVWLDYRDRSWDVYAARWQGPGFTAPQRIDGAPPEAHERLCGEPRVDSAGTRVIAAWSDLRERGAHPDVAWVESTDGGVTWSPRALVPDGPGSVPSRTRGGVAMPRYRPDVLLSAEGEAKLVFQDLAPDKSAIFGAVLGQAAARIDDTADAPVSLTRPRAAHAGTTRFVVWEDDRDGAYRIYAAPLD